MLLSQPIELPSVWVVFKTLGYMFLLSIVYFFARLFQVRYMFRRASKKYGIVSEQETKRNPVHSLETRPVN